MAQPALFDDDLEGPDLTIEVQRCAAGDDARRWFHDVLSSTEWSRDEITIFGRTTLVPRLSAWYGDPDALYSYSGIRLEPMSWSPVLREIREFVQDRCGTKFNSVLVNLYRDGRDGVGWHADDEPELGPEPTIASLSLGASRTFQLRHRADRSIRRSLVFHHGDLMVMAGTTQRCWVHQVPKTSLRVAPRINLTFRRVNGPTSW